MLSLVPRAQAAQVSLALCQSINASNIKLPVRTITYDNGKNFSSHKKTSKTLGCKAFFATPYHSWERVLNEHTNGLVSQYLPKKTNFLHVTTATLKEIENKLNNRPRKVLAYKTPLDVLQGKTSPQKIALRC